jgi:flagellar hook-length control protein FliK
MQGTLLQVLHSPSQAHAARGSAAASGRAAETDEAGFDDALSSASADLGEANGDPAADLASAPPGGVQTRALAEGGDTAAVGSARAAANDGAERNRTPHGAPDADAPGPGVARAGVGAQGRARTASGLPDRAALLRAAAAQGMRARSAEPANNTPTGPHADTGGARTRAAASPASAAGGTPTDRTGKGPTQIAPAGVTRFTGLEPAGEPTRPTTDRPAPALDADTPGESQAAAVRAAATGPSRGTTTLTLEVAGQRAHLERVRPQADAGSRQAHPALAAVRPERAPAEGAPRATVTLASTSLREGSVPQHAAGAPGSAHAAGAPGSAHAAGAPGSAHAAGRPEVSGSTGSPQAATAAVAEATTAPPGAAGGSPVGAAWTPALAGQPAAAQPRGASSERSSDTTMASRAPQRVGAGVASSAGAEPGLPRKVAGAHQGATKAGETEPATAPGGTLAGSATQAAAWLQALENAVQTPPGEALAAPTTEGVGAVPGAVAAAERPASAETEPGAAAEARIDAHPDSPQFAPMLGARVAAMVRDGIEQARIALNPAELGPVAVQVELSGTQVRVELAAEIEATRLALEQSLPALAGSLREAGFTLAGGGVFQQARDSGTGAQGQSGTESGPGTPTLARQADAAAPAPRAPRAGSAGLVDVYA